MTLRRLVKFSEFIDISPTVLYGLT